MRRLILRLAVAALILVAVPAAWAQAERMYHVVENGAQAGPYTVDELQARAGAGGVTGQTLVWTDGMTQWTPVAQVPELAAVLGGTAVPEAPRDFTGFLAGTWVADTAQVPVAGVGLGSAEVETHYHPAGAFELSGSIVGVYSGGIDFRINLAATGTYKVQPAGADSFRVVHEGNLMSTWVSRDPNVPSVPEISKLEPATYQILDENTIKDGEGYISRRRP